MTGSRRVILRRLSMAVQSSGSASSHKEERDSRSRATSKITDDSSSETKTVTFSGSSVTDASQRPHRPRLLCGLMAPDDSGKPVKASDYERVTVDTPSMGKVSLRKLSFSNRQMVRSQHKAEAEGTLFLVTNRKSWSLYYVLLRMSSYRFWTTVIFVQAALVLTGFIIFSAIRQPKGNAMLLGLDVNSLAVGDVECVAMFGDASWGCRAVAAVLSLASLVVSLFVGGVIVVRLSRVVAKHRFEFSKNAVIQDGELVVRFFSNRPSMVIMPTFRLEYFDVHGRARPLALINGGSICFMHDAALYIRHDIREGPFADPSWSVLCLCHEHPKRNACYRREVVKKVRVSVMGFDELLAQDVCGCVLYHTCNILDNVDFADVITRGKIDAGESEPRTALFFDMRRLNDVVPRTAEPISTVNTLQDDTTLDDKTSAQRDGWWWQWCPKTLRSRFRFGMNHHRRTARSAESLKQLADLQGDDEELRAVDVLSETVTNVTDKERVHAQATVDRLSNQNDRFMLREFKLHGGGESFDDNDASSALKLCDVDYATRQGLRTLMQSRTTSAGMLLLVHNRRMPIPWHYLFLRMPNKHFWAALVAVSVAIMCAAALVFFVVGGQSVSNSIMLSLDANGLGVGDVVCERTFFESSVSGNWPCFLVGALAKCVHFICELFFGAIIIVRLSRVVTQNRFEFAEFCVLDTDHGELVIRIVSNRPSTIIMPTFVLEYMDTHGKRLHPLELTNGGTVAYLNDSTFFLRHKIDRGSPFSLPDWRNQVIGVRIAVVGFDELCSQEACGCRFYAMSDIKTDVEFGPMVSTGRIKFKKALHHAYLVDMLRINAQLPKERDEHVDHYAPPPLSNDVSLSSRPGSSVSSIGDESGISDRLAAVVEEKDDRPPSLDIANLGLPSIKGPLSREQHARNRVKDDRYRTLVTRHSEPLVGSGEFPVLEDEDVNNIGIIEGIPTSPSAPLARVTLGVIEPAEDFEEPIEPRKLRVHYSEN